MDNIRYTQLQDRFNYGPWVQNLTELNNITEERPYTLRYVVDEDAIYRFIPDFPNEKRSTGTWETTGVDFDILAEGDEGDLITFDSSGNLTLKNVIRMNEGAGPQPNTPTGNQAVTMGRSTSAAGASALAIGNSTSASGDNSLALGASNTASGFASFCGGGSSTASATRSFVFSNNSSAASTGSVVLGGISASIDGNSSGAMALNGGTITTSPSAISLGTGTISGSDNAINIGYVNTITDAIQAITIGNSVKALSHGQIALNGSGSIAQAGDKQTSIYHQHFQVGTWADDTMYTLYNDGSAAEILTEDDTTYHIHAKIIARGTSGGSDGLSGVYELRGAAARGTGVASLTILGTATRTQVYDGIGFQFTNIANGSDLIANTTNGTIQIQIESVAGSGNAGNAVTLMASVEIVKLRI